MDTAIQLKNESLEKTIEVLQLQFEDPTRTITGLCLHVGIPRYQYYRYLREGTEIVEALRLLIMQSKRVELATISSSRHRILENLVDEALETKDITEMVKTLEYLDTHEKELQNDVGATPGLEDDAREFLKHGPKIQKQESKFASIRVSEDDDGEPVIDIYKQHDVIEGISEDVP